MKTRPVGAKFSHADGWRDRQIRQTRRSLSQFCEHALEHVVHITVTSQCEWPEKWARKQIYKYPVYSKIFIK